MVGEGRWWGEGLLDPSPRPLFSSSSLAVRSVGLAFPDMSQCLVSLTVLWLPSLRPLHTLRSLARLF